LNSEEEVRILADETRLAQRCGRTALTFDQPPAYLLGDARILSPIIWIVRFGHANQVVVDWLTARDARPDCVLISNRTWPPSAKLLAADPLLQWIKARYVQVGLANNLTLLHPLEPPPGNGAP
jgi:hypothetical protein